jgi:hypothetical protein
MGLVVYLGICRICFGVELVVLGNWIGYYDSRDKL